MTLASQLDRDAFVSTLERFRDLGLVTPAETDEVLALFDPNSRTPTRSRPPSRSTCT